MFRINAEIIYLDETKKRVRVKWFSQILEKLVVF